MPEELSGPLLRVCVLSGCGLVPPCPRVARARMGALRRDRGAGGAGREGFFCKRGAACGNRFGEARSGLVLWCKTEAWRRAEQS